MFKDILAQAWEALLFNRRRSIITMIGMAWGIATVVLLLAYGAGFSRAFETIFAQWGTTLMGVYPGKTSEQAGGDKAGVDVRFMMDDVDLVWNNVPGLIHITPYANLNATVQDDLHTYTWTVNGYRPIIQEIMKFDIAQGRFYNAAEDQQRAHVAVLGSEAKTKLFGGRYAIGENVRLNGISFTVVGVLKPKMNEGDNDNNRQVYVPFNTMGDLKDTTHLDGIMMNFEGDDQKIEHNLRNTLAAAHHFRPSDHRAIFVENLMEQLNQFRILSLAMEVLLALVGTLTLGIAGIGLMNIMLVSVQQRTREIGIEKALGARKHHILVQFLTEAFVITAIGGICGVLLAYVISLCVGRITFYSAIATDAEAADIYLLISPVTVMVSTGILIITGLISGMIPAIRAANLDPIEALRYE